MAPAFDWKTRPVGVRYITRLGPLEPGPVTPDVEPQTGALRKIERAIVQPLGAAKARPVDCARSGVDQRVSPIGGQTPDGVNSFPNRVRKF
jgi:hypothetical protein